MPANYLNADFKTSVAVAEFVRIRTRGNKRRNSHEFNCGFDQPWQVELK